MSDASSTALADVSATANDRIATALTRRLAWLTFHADFEEERFFLILPIFIGITDAKSLRIHFCIFGTSCAASSGGMCSAAST